MSELKRSQSLFSQRPPSARAPCRAVREPPPCATASAELRLLEPLEITAVQGGDPYNGIGSRAMTAPRMLRK